MRKVIVNSRKYVNSKGGCGCWTGVEFKGFFHKWGLALYRHKTSDNVVNYTVAIVEDENGKIYLIDPEYVTFEKE